MDPFEELDRRGQVLLTALAADPDDGDCARQFDSLFYEAVWRYLRGNQATLGLRVARYLGLPGAVAPQVLAEEVDEVAHDATAIALRRVRQNAHKFDASKGRPTQWVIGSAEYAYIEVAKAVAFARRSDTLTFLDPLDPTNALSTEPSRNPTTEDLVMRHLADAEALADAARHLSDREFAALRLRGTAGYSRGEAAERIFGDSAMKKQVDGLAERGARKLAAAWSDHKPMHRGVGSTNVSASADDKEETDG